MEKCEDCQGTGHTGSTNCCGAEFYENTDICRECKEHSDDECPECEGTGEVEDYEGETAFNNELLRSDDRNKALKENSI